MGLSDVLRGWISREDSAGDDATAADPSREPTPGDAPDPDLDSDPDTAHETVVYECRNCGTTVDAGADSCPTCGSEAIAEYPIE